MTGKEMIMYILHHDLLDVEIGLTIEVKKDSQLISPFISAEEAAIKFGVGIETVIAWYMLGKLPGQFRNGDFYILRDADKPIV